MINIEQLKRYWVVFMISSDIYARKDSAQQNVIFTLISIINMVRLLYCLWNDIRQSKMISNNIYDTEQHKDNVLILVSIIKKIIHTNDIIPDLWYFNIEIKFCCLILINIINITIYCLWESNLFIFMILINIKTLFYYLPVS